MGEPTVSSEAVLGCLPDAVLVVRGEHVVWANPRALELFGRPQLEGLALPGLFADGEYERIERLRQQRAHGWRLPDTCRVRLSGSPTVVDLRAGELAAG